MKKIIISLFLALGLTSSAYADACSDSLMPTFTANQATALCTTFPISAVALATLRPGTDNAFDLGATSFSWRSIYIGTSRISLTSDILRVRQDANRLFTWDASSDSAFTFKFGDAGTTATQALITSASTADADDDSTVTHCGGGGYAADGSRGACIVLPGEDVAGGGDISYVAGASDTHVFSAGSTQTMSIGATGLVTAAAGFTATTGDVTATTGGFVASASGETLELQEATAGSKCMGTLTLTAATPVVTATTCAKTASRIFLTRTSIDADTTGDMAVTAIVDATSFSVTSEANDTGTVNWLIINEAP